MKESLPSLRWLAIFLALAGLAVRAADSDTDSGSDLQDNDHSSYHLALLNYKSGKYDAARAFIETAEKAQPGNIPVEMLKVRILTEQHDYKQAQSVLEGLNGNPAMTAEYGQAVTLAFGDLMLRQHKFEDAAKFYTSLLVSTPADADLKLRLVYAHIGAGNLVDANKDASGLKPTDPTNPSYYFARAAIARATGDTGAEEQDMEQARTIYGITHTDRYLKTYLQVFSPEKHSASNPRTPTTNTAPATTVP